MASPTPARPELCGQEDDYAEEEIDPRIKVELESLNQAASDINCLEKEINEARAKYQVTFSECSADLEVLRKKYGVKIKKVRPYYEMKELAKEAQSEALRSARKFQSANSVYLAAKETISLAELRLMDDKAANLSTAWQEMLNHAVIRVMEAEKEKSKNEKDHLEKAAAFAQLEQKMHLVERKFKRSIEKAKPYFDAKNELELKLQQIKQSIEDLQQAMQSAKSRYSNSLKRLEAISDGIHELRRKRLMLMYPREPGVGAEEAASETVEELPTLQASYFQDNDASSVTSDKCKYDDDLEDESEDGDCGQCDDDLSNGNKLRQKVLTCPLDSEDSVFTKPKNPRRKRLVKSKSIPAYLGQEPVCEDITKAFICTKNNRVDADSEKSSSCQVIDEEPDQDFSSKSQMCSDNQAGDIENGTQNLTLRVECEGQNQDVR